MKQTIRLSLLLSATALFASACTNMPVEGQNSSYSSGYTSPVAANTTSNHVPEAGPLSDPAPATPSALSYTQEPVITRVPAQPVPVAMAPQPVPVATVPQAPATPVVPATGGGYDVYAASSSSTITNYAAPVVDYSQPQGQGGANTSYTTYGTAPDNTAAVNTYYPDNSNESYDSYTNTSTGGGNNYSAGNSYNNTSGGGGGSAAIQVFATGSAAKAERIRQDMQSQGLPAVVDQVSGLYKVRIPYSDSGAARANLERVRQASGEAGAFVTTR